MPEEAKVSSAVVQLRWVSPDSVPEKSDLAQLPRCPKTRRTIVDQFGEFTRHAQHRDKTRFVKSLEERRGRDLPDHLNRLLFDENANPDPDLFVGYKLTRRQRAQHKILKKERAKSVAVTPGTSGV